MEFLSKMMRHILSGRCCSSAGGVVRQDIPFQLGRFLQQRRRLSLSACKQALRNSPSNDDATASKLRWSDLKKLLALAKPVRGKLAVGVSLLAVSSAVTVSVPFVLGRIIDSTVSITSVLRRADPDPDDAAAAADELLQRLGRFCVVLVGVFCLGAAANAGRVYCMQMAGQAVTNGLRTSVFGAVLRQEVAFFSTTSTGELVNRLSNDATRVGGAVSVNISDGLRSLVTATAGASMMYYVSPKLSVLGVGVVVPITVMAILYGRYVHSLTKKMNDALAGATHVAEEKISSIRTVRAFAAEPREERLYASRIADVLTFAHKDAAASGVFYACTGLSGNLTMLVILYGGAHMISTGAMSVGELSSFLVYALYVGVSVAGLSGFYSELMRGLGASTRLFHLVDRRPAIPISGGERPTELRGDVHLEGVHFAFPDRPDVAVLTALDLRVPAGSVTALVGASGSGKSTLAALLLRFFDPTDGRVLLDGRDVRSLDPSWLRSHVGTVSQEPVLFADTIAVNVAYGAPSADAVSTEQLREAARQANALDFIEQLPDQWDSQVGERGAMLSGGQKQRIAIARALLMNPKLLILDEATSALDAESEYQVRKALDKLLSVRQRTVLIIAHRLSTIKSADQIAVLDKGRIVESGSFDELMAIEQGYFRKLVDKQTVASWTDDF